MQMSSRIISSRNLENVTAVTEEALLYFSFTGKTLSGTGVQIAPVVEVDDRAIGTGSIGPVAERLQELYFKAARGGWDAYADWTVAVEVAEGARR